MTLGINYYFGERELDDGFLTRNDVSPSGGSARSFARRLMRLFDVEVHGVDRVDARADDIKAVLYMDSSWRSLRADRFLRQVPFEKRALVLIEPANVNPSMYYLSRYRKLFAKVFTWDERLAAKNPDYVLTHVYPGLDAERYQGEKFRSIPFSEKKLLFAASCNRWHYMPQSTYKERRRIYRYFERNQPDQFDFFGPGWNAPAGPFEKYLGYPKFSCWRGFLPGGFEGKTEKMAHYKFAVSLENNASQPGYISEKITDCFAARCVPIYLGSRGYERHIPSCTYINYADFKSLAELERYLVSMSEVEHMRYLDAIERFVKSSDFQYFSADRFAELIGDGLGLKRRSGVLQKEER